MKIGCIVVKQPIFNYVNYINVSANKKKEKCRALLMTIDQLTAKVLSAVTIAAFSTSIALSCTPYFFRAKFFAIIIPFLIDTSRFAPEKPLNRLGT